jgi:superfamily II DNA or RNA helicase
VEKTTSWVRRWLAQSRGGEAGDDAPARVGDLSLADHQSRAVVRGVEIARRYGGVLIADAVGLGKTRVGLGVARVLARDERMMGGDDLRRAVWVCAPARLRADWEESLASARVDGEVVSHTQLSRHGEGLMAGEPGVMIVDEAHRFRNPSAERSQTLARLATRSPLVLVTATPVCNDVWDLYHLLTYFMAEDDLREVIGYDLRDGFARAECGDWDLTELLERVAIRRRNIEGWSNRPTVRLEKLTYDPGEAELWVWRHLESRLRGLTLEAFGGDWPKGLFVEHVRKRWESAPEAAHRTLEHVALFHRRWLQAAKRGHRLGRPEYKRWFSGDARQEAMPFVLDGTVSEETDSGGAVGLTGSVLRSVREDLEVIDGLVSRIDAAIAEQRGAAGAVADLVASANGKVLVFCEYYRTAETYYQTMVSRLGSGGRVGLVTGDVAKATGLGRTNARELRTRFAPTAAGGGYTESHQQIEVLVATDCLAEGVNLQDCGKLVLADMPYSPLRIEQRVGRLVRPGSPHAEVEVYLPEPSAWVETLGLQSRVSRKVEQARQVGSQPAAAASLTQRTETAAPTKPDDEWAPVGPMEAVTRLDALYRKLQDADTPTGMGDNSGQTERPDWWIERDDGMGRHSEGGEVEEAWARWCIRPAGGGSSSATAQIWGWARVRDGDLTLRRSHLVKPLTAIAQSDRPLERCEPSPTWLEPLHSWLDHRVSTLTSASLAPAPISIDDPQWKLWARLRDAVESGGLECTQETLQRVRSALLQSLPQGGRRRFARWWASDPPAESIIERANRRDMSRTERGVERWVAEVRSVMLIRGAPRPPDEIA